jgi:glycosyltransferase involved in cell wall biosynthesis
MAVSDAVREAAIHSDNIPADRVRVALNGIPDLRSVHDGEVRALRDRLGIGDELVVLLLARLRPEKGHEVLLEAMQLAAPDLPRPSHLVIVGDGPHRAAVAASAERVDGCKVHLVGYQEDVALWLRLADVVASPSLIEPFGLSTIEAMAAGRPVVASAVDGLLEVVVPGAGLLVPPGDSRSLAAAITETLLDASLRVRLGSAGRIRFLESFTIEKMVERWMGVYEEMVPIFRTA